MTSARAQAPAFLVKDIDQIPAIESSNPTDFSTIGGVTFFFAETHSTGRELWRTDGTASGTSLAVDLWPGVASSFPEQLSAVGGTLFFIATDVAGKALFASDGTPAGRGQRMSGVMGSENVWGQVWK